MLPDWYFCSSIKADPDKTAIFLQILESLSKAEQDPEVASLGIRELQLLDPWMQTYALPAVLRTIGRQGASKELQSSLKRYFADLTEILPEAFAEPFEQLEAALLRGGNSSDVMTALRGCLRALKPSSLGAPSSTPYLDLREFLPETAILAVLADRLLRDRAFSALLEGSDKAADTLGQLLEAALQHALGRLAFRLALTVAKLGISRYTVERLEDVIWRIPAADPEIEPDLLASWAELIGNDLAGDQDALVEALLLESITLGRLRRRRNERLNRSQPPLANPLLAIPNNDVRLPLSVVLWQSVLWQLASRVSPSAAARYLAGLWLPPSLVPGATVQIKAPLSEAARQQLQEDLSQLAGLRGWLRRLLVGYSQFLELPETVWAIFSPWIQFNSNRKALSDSKIPRYPAVERPAAQVRLLAAAFLGGELLLALSKDHTERPALGALLVHAADVLASLRLPSGPPGRRTVETHSQLPQPYLGLAIYVQRYIEKLGSCQDERIAPQDFLAFQPRLANGLKSAEEDVIFVQMILPSVLISWVMNAYLSAASTNPSMRWLSLIPELYDRQQEKDTFLHKLRAEVVARFLCPEVRRIREGFFNWQIALSRGRSIQPRQILVTSPVNAEGWNREDLNAIDDGQTRLVIALERLSSLTERSSLSMEIQERWQREWADRLSGVNEAKNLDRFIRLRLLELLEEPILRDDLPGRELIALTLIEYGSAYEIERLFDRLYPGDETAWRQLPDRATQDLREVLIRALYREIDRGTEERTRRLTAQDLYLDQDALQREQLIRETLRRTAFFHRPAGSAANRERMSGALTALYDEALALNASLLRCIDAETVSDERGRRVLLPAEAGTLSQWQIRSAVLDPNLATVKLLVEDLTIGDAYDLFSLPPEEVEALVGRREAMVLLSSVVESAPVTGDGRRYTTYFHCGLEIYLKTTLPQRFEVGELFRLPIFWREERQRWDIDFRDGRRIARLRRSIQPGDLGRLSLREIRDPRDSAITLKLRDGMTENEADYEIWCGNPAWLFRLCGDNRRFDLGRNVDARLDSGRVWRPVERDLTQLLLAPAAFGREGPAVLAYLGSDEVAGTWKFSLRPGEVYALSATDFIADDAEDLAEEIEAHGDARGLLISVEAKIVDQRLRLLLSRQPFLDPEGLAFYPRLETPFDRRNMIWRRFIQRAGTLVAHHSGSRWEVALEGAPAGFPAVVRVSWPQKRPGVDQDESEATVLGWYPWRGEIVAEAVQTHRIHLDASETREDFTRRWLALQRGGRVGLLQALRPVGEQGDVLCRTAEHVLVFVEAESLSMRLLSEDEPLDFDGVRQGEIVRNPWTGPQSLDFDIEQVPEKIRLAGGAQGVLVEIPKRTAGGESRCEIWWQLGEIVIESGLQIKNLAQLRNLAVGARIRLRQLGERWSCEAEPFRGKVRALWSLEEWSRPLSGLSYLGTIPFGEGMRPIAEQMPGRLILLPEGTEVHRHLATGNGRSFLGGLGQEQRARNINQQLPPRHGGDCRATLRFREGVLCGACGVDEIFDPLVVTQIKWRLEPRLHGFFDLRRRFSFAADARRRPESRGDAAVWQPKLDEYFNSPEDLDGSLDIDRHEVRLSKLRVPRGSGSWLHNVPLAVDEAPFVAIGYPTDNVRVRLFKDTASRIFSSFRRVPPQTIDRFRSDLGSPAFGRTFPLLNALYYVGPEPSEEGAEDQLHRFEWGYGRTLVAPESRLRFDGGPFSRARTILFFGDKITGVTFLQAENRVVKEADENEDDEGEDLSETFSEAPRIPLAILSIDEVQLEFSDATLLYRQGKRYRIVQLLHLHERPDGSIGIRSILGMEERNTETPHRPFRVDRAELDPGSEEILRRRGRPKSTSGGETEKERVNWVVLARLDLDVFRRSFGLEVVFRLVRLSFQPASEGTGEPIKQGELVFLQAGKIIPLRNDLALELRPWNGLDSWDVGAECRRLLLLRRSFSVREDLLPRIYEAEGENALKGSAYLVKIEEITLAGGTERTSTALLWSEDRSGGRGRSGHRAGIPSRTLGALRRAATREIVLASVVDATEAVLLVELKPGVFVTLESHHIELLPGGLRPGAVVRIDNLDNGRFRVSRALQGEEWYLPPGLRPVVTLPLNTLIDERSIQGWNPRNPKTWRAAERFSIGGLPNVLAVPGSYDERKNDWDDPVAEDFIALMRIRHPKIGLAGRDNTGAARIEPAHSSLEAGRVLLDPQGQTARFMLQEDSGASPRPLLWEFLSFADEAIESLARRIAQGSWRYHDTQTGFWLESGGIEPQKLGLHSAQSGPLFFESHKGELRLRYTESNLSRYGFPVRELVRALSENRQEDYRAWFTVAGVLPEGGLWIEISPGRVANLPASIVVLPLEDREQSLAHLQWFAFAPGDQILLRLYSSDPMTIDRIAFEDWRPGPRRALGRRAILPVRQADVQRGALRLGGGELQLELPVVWTGEPPDNIVLFSDNYFLVAPDRLPNPGDTVLLGLSPDGAPCVLGFPGLKPQPEAQRLESWELDPLSNDIAALQLHPGRRSQQLAHFLTAAGGSLPVTVEVVVARDHVLYFSRSSQRAGSVLPSGQVSPGRVLGLLRDGESALIRCGSGVVKTPLDRLVSGLPRDLNTLAAKILHQRETLIWLRGSASGDAVYFGLGAETGPEINIEILEIIETAGPSSRARLGAICRSRSTLALYWLPAREASWTSLSNDEFSLLRERNRRYRAYLVAPKNRDTLFVSLTRVAEVYKEFRSLAIGKELAVHLLRRRTESDDLPMRYLAEARGVRMALEVEAPEGQDFDFNQPILVEVLRCSSPGGQPTVLAVPVGERRYTLDLPSWSLREKPRTLREEFSQYLQWFVEPPEPPELGSLPPNHMTDTELRRHLCHLWRLPVEGPLAFTLIRWQVELSGLWWTRNILQSEMDLPYALISLILLQKATERGAEGIAAMEPKLSLSYISTYVEELRQQVFKSLQNLGQRALRSRHVEVLWQEWLSPEADPPRIGDLRHRLEQLTLSSSLKLDSFRAFQQFCRAVELRQSLPGYESLLPLYDAIRRAIGQPEVTGTLAARAEILNGIVKIYRTLPPARSGWVPNLRASHVNSLEDMLAKVTSQRMDITLLEPLTGERLQVAGARQALRERDS